MLPFFVDLFLSFSHLELPGHPEHLLLPLELPLEPLLHPLPPLSRPLVPSHLLETEEEFFVHQRIDYAVVTLPPNSIRR